jgi:hypothetical protein
MKSQVDDLFYPIFFLIKSSTGGFLLRIPGFPNIQLVYI